MQASAIVFENPKFLSLKSLAVADMGDQDVEVEVEYSGISTGTAAVGRHHASVSGHGLPAGAGL